MFSTITDSKGKKYCFYVRNDIYDEIDLTITNGTDVWMNADEINERKITYECRPTSRKKESKLSYLNSLKSALIVDPNKIDLPSITKYFYEIVISGEKEETLSLTLKEQLPETSLMTILYKGSFVKKEQEEETEGTSSSLMDLLQSLSTVIHDKSSSITDLEKKNNEFASLISKNIQDIQLLNDLKENLQDTMIQKFCLILNEKKTEILQLRRELGEKVMDNTIVGKSSQQKGKVVEIVDDEEGEDGEGEEMPPLTLTTKAKGTRSRKATSSTAAPKPPSKRVPATKKTGLDQIQSKMKKAATTTSKRNSRKKTSVSSDEEDDDEDDEAAEENDNDEDTSDEQQPQPQAKKGFSFDHIKKLAKELENNSKSSTTSFKKADDSDDVTDDEAIKTTAGASSSSSFLSKRGKEVDGSQIINFLSSQSQPSLQEQASSSSSSAHHDKNKKEKDDDTNDESTSAPVVVPTKRPLQGITQQDHKKKKSRRLLDDSDED
jgi:hypothetical protein